MHKPYTTVFDLMCCVQVLFVSANLTGNHTLIDIATSHADKTAINHVRPDGTRIYKDSAKSMLKETSNLEVPRFT